jgi:hypothetical protein
VDGRSRRIQLWGGISAPTGIGRRGSGGRSSKRAIFLTNHEDVFARDEVQDAGPASRSQGRPFVRKDNAQTII